MELKTKYSRHFFKNFKKIKSFSRRFYRTDNISGFKTEDYRDEPIYENDGQLFFDCDR